MHTRAYCSCGSLVASRSTPQGYAVRLETFAAHLLPARRLDARGGDPAATMSAAKRHLYISRRTHPSRLDVFGKTEAAGQRGVGEEGDLVDLAAAQGEHHHAPGPRA